MSGATLIWLLDSGALAGAELDEHAAWLGQDERERCARFVRPERRRQFIAGRVLLRHALGRLLDVAPRDIALRERAGNAPALATPAPPGLGFSISHSGPWVACAASSVSRLRALEGTDRVRAFYRMWCLHEAHIKLGGPAGDDYADYLYEAPGLTICPSTAQPLEAAPALVAVGPGALRMLP